MSLLNDALRDLESRKTRPDAPAGTQGYGNLVAISSESSRSSVLVIGVILLCLIAGAAFWWMTRKTVSSPSVTPQLATFPTGTTQQQGAVDRSASAMPNLIPPAQRLETVASTTTKAMPDTQMLASTPAGTQDVKAVKLSHSPDINAEPQPSAKLTNNVAKTASKKDKRVISEINPPKAVSPSSEKPVTTQQPHQKPVRQHQKTEKVATKGPAHTKTHPIKPIVALAAVSPKTDRNASNVNAQTKEADTTNAHLEKKIRLTPEQIDEKNASAAKRLYAKGDEKQANAALYDFIRHQQVNQKSTLVLASHFIQQGRLDEASALLPSSRIANSPTLTLLKARIFVLQGKPRTALALLQQSSDTAADNLDYQAFLAFLYQQEGDFKAAVKTYGGLLEQRPEHADWWVGLGISLSGISDKTNALRSYKKALSLPGLNQQLKAYAQAQVQALAPESSSVSE